MAEIREAIATDALQIKLLAEKIWWPTYSPIISAAQIQYMLDKMYDSAIIEQQINSGTQKYLLLYAEDTLTGFAAFSIRAENEDIYKLHKLYCLTHTKGMGYGRELLEAVESEVLNTGKKILELNVNRQNPTIGFYEKMGFEIAYTEDIDIGNGYEMNDYVMRKLLL